MIAPLAKFIEWPLVRVTCFTTLLTAVSFHAAAEVLTNAIRASDKSVFPGVDWEYETNGLSPEAVRGVDTFVHTLDMVVAHKTCPPGDVGESDYFRLLDLLTGKKPASAAELASWTFLQSKAHPQPKAHIAIELDPKVYNAYVGQYAMDQDPKLAGIVTMTIKRDGDALFRQVPGQFAQEIFPESETVFFNATEDERLTFVKNGRGEVTGLIVDQNGTFGESGRKELKLEK